MSDNKYPASDSLANRYISRKVSEAYYSILFGLVLFTIIGTGFYLKLDNQMLVCINLCVIAIPFGISIYMSTIKQAKNMNKIISLISVNDVEYRIKTYPFKIIFFSLPANEFTLKKGSIETKKIAFPYNEDGLESDKKDTLCIVSEGEEFYLLYHYFPAALLAEIIPQQIS
jgi:hypothetical protein